MAVPLKFRCRRLQIRALGNFERGGLIGRRTGEVAKGVLALIRFEIDGVSRTVRDFEAQIVRREFGGTIEISSAKPDVGDVLKPDHVEDLLLRRARMNRPSRLKRRYTRRSCIRSPSCTAPWDRRETAAAGAFPLGPRLPPRQS